MNETICLGNVRLDDCGINSTTLHCDCFGAILVFHIEIKESPAIDSWYLSKLQRNYKIQGSLCFNAVGNP